MIEPNGPLPAGVYWRRRAVAAVASILATVVLAWIVGGFVGSADDEPVQARGVSRHPGRQPSSPPPPSSRTAAPSSATTSAATSAPTSAPTPAPTTPATSTPSGPPGPCPDTAITVSARSDKPSYRVGERPELHLIVANTGPVPCVRDVNRKLRELLILSGDGRVRMWSSNDCYGPPGTDERTLVPGRPLVFRLTWAGRTSAPGCPVERTTVPAGSYRLVGKLGRLTGAPVPLVLTP